MSSFCPVPRSQLAVRSCPACGHAVTAALGSGGSVIFHDDPPSRRSRGRGYVWVTHSCAPPPVLPPAPPAEALGLF